MLIEWTEKANTDLSEIYAYFLSIGDEEQGKYIASRLIKSTNNLSLYPLIGRQGQIEGTRELLVQKLPYIIIYKLVDDVVKIIHVFHTSRLFPEL